MTWNVPFGTSEWKDEFQNGRRTEIPGRVVFCDEQPKHLIIIRMGNTAKKNKGEEAIAQSVGF